MRVRRSVDLYRDRYGIPHIFAKDIEGAYFGLGYAAAQERPTALELHQSALDGRIAEVVGRVPLPDRRLAFLDGLSRAPLLADVPGFARVRTTLDADRWMRLFRYSELAARALDELPERSRAIVEAFARGVNEYFQRARPSAEQYRPETEIAWWVHFEHVIASSFGGSNAFAIGRERTVDKSAIVAGDPHYWIGDGHGEAHLVADNESFELHGVWDGHVNVGFWGGSNSEIAMALTAAGFERATIYREHLDPHTRTTYWDARRGEFTPLGVARHMIQERGGDGDELLARYTHHGPVVADDPGAAATAFAVRSAFLDDPAGCLHQQLALWQCASVDEAVAFLAKAPFVRGHRLFGDRAGHIALASNGPIRTRDVSIDWTTIVDGKSTAAEWNDEWWSVGGPPGTRLPVNVDPPAGYLQSANDAPWFAATPLDRRTAYPDYVFSSTWRELGVRGARQRYLLEGVHGGGVEDASAFLFDDFVPHAFLAINSLRCRRRSELSADARSLDALLESWDGRARSSSAAMTIAFYLDRVLPEGLPAPRIVPADDPRATPEIQAPTLSDAAGRAYVEALERVATILKTQYGTLVKPWGEIHVLQTRDRTVAAGGGCNALEALFGSYRGWLGTGDDELDHSGVERCDCGSRTLRLTVLRPDGVEVWSVSGTGQAATSEEVNSQHIEDQALLYSAYKLKKFALTRAELLEDGDFDHAGCTHSNHEVVTY